jgi:hypothetical protein
MKKALFSLFFIIPFSYSYSQGTKDKIHCAIFNSIIERMEEINSCFGKDTIEYYNYYISKIHESQKQINISLININCNNYIDTSLVSGFYRFNKAIIVFYQDNYSLTTSFIDPNIEELSQIIDTSYLTFHTKRSDGGIISSPRGYVFSFRKNMIRKNELEIKYISYFPLQTMSKEFWPFDGFISTKTCKIYTNNKFHSSNIISKCNRYAGGNSLTSEEEQNLYYGSFKVRLK